MDRARAFFRNEGFAGSVLTLSGSTMVGQGLVLVSTPLLTRLYTPTDLGMLGLYVAILMVLGRVVCLCYEQAIPLCESKQQAADLLVLGLFITLGLSMLAEAVVLWRGHVIARLFNMPQLGDYLWLLPLSLLGMGVYQALNYWSIRTKQFGSLAVTNISRSAARVGTQIVLGLMEIRPVGLLLGNVAGQFGGCGVLMSKVWREGGQYIRGVSLPSMVSSAWRYRRFPMISGSSALLNSMGRNLPPLLLAAYYPAHVVGWFALSQRIVSMPATLMGDAVAKVYLGELSERYRNDRANVPSLFFKTAKRLVMVALPVALLNLVAPWIFAFLFGSEWREAGVYVQILAVALAAQLAVVPLSGTLIVVGRLDIQFYWDVARFVAVAGGLISMGTLGKSATRAVAVYGIIMVFMYMVLFFLMMREVRRRALYSSG